VRLIGREFRALATLLYRSGIAFRSRANLRSQSRSAIGGYPVSVKAEPIEETKESGIILAPTGRGQRLNNCAAILRSEKREGTGTIPAIRNLRLATRQQQACNTGARKPGHPKGCHWNQRGRKWSAWIYINGRKLSLGAFERLGGRQGCSLSG